VRGLIGDDRATLGDHVISDCNALWLMRANERKRSAFALPERNHDATLAALVWRKTTIYSVFFQIGGGI
jgi:hypothetical protein